MKIAKNADEATPKAPRERIEKQDHTQPKKTKRRKAKWPPPRKRIEERYKRGEITKAEYTEQIKERIEADAEEALSFLRDTSPEPKDKKAKKPKDPRSFLRETSPEQKDATPTKAEARTRNVWARGALKLEDETQAPNPEATQDIE